MRDNEISIADRVIARPSLSGLGAVAQGRQLDEFANDVALFALFSLKEWTEIAAADPEAARRFYESGDRESTARRSAVLRNLITVLSDPDDVNTVATTVLRLMEEYVDRSMLFIATPSEFVSTGTTANVRIPRHATSVLADAADLQRTQRGKIRRTPANVALIEKIGGSVPTEVVVLPIVHDGSTIAVLYGDNAHHRAPIEIMPSVEIFLVHAADAFARALSGAADGEVSLWL
ncbi:MAG TPA: hypothetical protein VLU46_02540 [Thermoanaerobaculia bacterium]|nr:hypothetical protein [Thermoanaerobaculia bacterium]